MYISFQHNSAASFITQHSFKIYSEYLERNVCFDVYKPCLNIAPESWKLLFINDGQDLQKMSFTTLLENEYGSHALKPLLCIGVHSTSQRLMEYGVAQQPDYKGRGAKAFLYTQFIVQELYPFLMAQYGITPFNEKAFAGFSLGGLSALDIAWNHAPFFSKVGVFSGSLWWRLKAYSEGYDDDKHRIMHQQIRQANGKKPLQFFIQCGALDETEDRNNNGIIDSIDDALDLIKELYAKGYAENEITYLELSNGRHDMATWKQAFPYFLSWGWAIS